MENIFNAFDDAFLNDDFLADIAAAEKGEPTEQKEVPTGRYEVKIHKMELTKSKKGDPMFSCWFKVVNGDYNNQLIFMNQVITKGFQVHIVNEFLRSLKSKQDVCFLNFQQYGALIRDVLFDIDKQFEYGLDYSENAKGFKEFKIFEAFPMNEAPF